jgi:hypothetical protein
VAADAMLAESFPVIADHTKTVSSVEGSPVPRRAPRNRSGRNRLLITVRQLVGLLPNHAGTWYGSCVTEQHTSRNSLSSA